jgi:hypothetical protein
LLSELHEHKDLIDNGNDENSSSGSEDCPSEDNLPKEVLRQILPMSKKAGNTKTKDMLAPIFGFPRRRKAEVKKKKPKEEKKVPPKVEKKMSRRFSITREEKKAKEEPVIQYVDASTQTERIYFQKARAKWVMTKFGKSYNQYKKLPCILNIYNRLSSAE